MPSSSELRNFAKPYESLCIEEYLKEYAKIIQDYILVKAYIDSPNKTTNPRPGAIEIGTSFGKWIDERSPKYGLILRLPVHFNTNSLSNNTLIRGLNTALGSYSMDTLSIGKIYQDEILKRIQELFPDIKITIDPLKTYVLFDWS
jgi:hypothetical protein